MKCILVGYPGSLKIKKATEYLNNKYLPFNYRHLVYEGELDGWGEYIANYLRIFEDEYILFALDDYLLGKPLDQRIFDTLLALMDKDHPVAKLCVCTPQENEEYPITTQYSIWNREYLISLLDRTTSPWDFEITGSRLFKQEGKKLLWGPALSYYTNSSLSNRWQGIKLAGLKDGDIKVVKKLL